MSGKIYHPESKHPEPYQQDLNTDANVAQNRGEIPQEGKTNTRTAFDLKDAHQALRGFTDDELRRIPILRPGSRLEQGATYIDLRAGQPHEFTANGDMEAGEENWFVPKGVVDDPLWNRLRGVDDPERTGQGGSSST